jgi:Flp pilus assembly protein TadG
MEKLIKKYEKKGGQVLVIVALMLVVLLSFSTLIIDGGSKSLTRRQIQNAADAAALAGARDLPDDTAQAIADAQAYALANGKSTDTVNVEVKSNKKPNDSITVSISRNSPSFLAQLFNQKNSTVVADASAGVAVAASVPWIVPFVIPKPEKFNYDQVYVMRMYGAGDYLDYLTTGYPSGYSYPNDYKTDPVYKDYPLGTITTYDIYTINYASGVNLKRDASSSSATLINIPYGTVVTYNYSKTVYSTVWYNVTYTYDSVDYTGFVQSNYVTKSTGTATTGSSVYPYQFDYMNVYIENSSDYSDYINWLGTGYHKTFSINQKMYYMAPSSGGRESVDTFATRVANDPNTDYTQAKVGEARVILIPVVASMLKRNTADHTQMTIIGFVGFFIQKVHKNSYGESFWFEGRFLEDLVVGTGEVTFDPNADFGLRVVTLTE